MDDFPYLLNTPALSLSYSRYQGRKWLWIYDVFHRPGFRSVTWNTDYTLHTEAASYLFVSSLE